VFFMYTPFKGRIMEEVLERLRRVALLKQIRIVTYGPCTAQVARQSWLSSTCYSEDNIYKLAVFYSQLN